MAAAVGGGTRFTNRPRREEGRKQEVWVSKDECMGRGVIYVADGPPKKGAASKLSLVRAEKYFLKMTPLSVVWRSGAVAHCSTARRASSLLDWDGGRRPFLKRAVIPRKRLIDHRIGTRFVLLL